MLIQRQTPSLRPLITAHLAQTMTLLGLSVMELQQQIDAELAANPALELVEGRRCPACHRPLVGVEACPVCSRPPHLAADEPIVFLSPRQDFRVGGGVAAVEDLPDDNAIPEVQDLPGYVLRQVAAELRPEDRPLAAHILTSLDDDGLLAVPPAEIALYHRVPLARVNDVLRLIQRADPLGVGSPSPQEALLVQLEVLNETRPAPPLAFEAVRRCMDLLSRHRYQELGRALGVSSAAARQVAQFISDNLNPYPARAHWGEIRSGDSAPVNVYHEPDVVISRLEQREDAPLVVEVATPLAGWLRVNPLFREALPQAPADKSEQWRLDLERAELLVKCMQQRNHTLVRLARRLAVLQRDFILQGDAYLQPITRAQLAQDLGVHESTISRAVSDKAVQLPNGHIIPMSSFFDRSRQVRTALKMLISQETTALNDNDLAQLLSRQGYAVARRTVAKYRAMEGILPAHLRQRLPARGAP